MQETAEIRLFIVDDHELIRFAMESWIKQDSEANTEQKSVSMRVVGTASNGRDAITFISEALTSEIPPNFLLIDYQLPDMLGSEVIQTLRGKGVETSQLRALVMTGMENAPVKSILSSGANGYLSKQEPSTTFLSAIRRIFAMPDELWLNPSEAKRMLNVDRTLATAGITKTEKIVLSLLYLTNEEISESLSISKGTVKNHLNNIYAKLGINSRQEAEVFAVKVGLLPKMHS
ncbi:MAG: response regulator transcription factor [Candidatus Kapabacteria bacterium]|nr:response regulator transcription factor [Candidatus Kapabacteria bacterium]